MSALNQPFSSYRSLDSGIARSMKKIYVPGEIHPGVRVPFLRIDQDPTTRADGTIQENPPVLVYDTTGPGGEEETHFPIEEGLPALRASWIEDRGDVEERKSPEGLLHERMPEKFRSRPVLVAKSGAPVTQMSYARRGIITPEMEFVAIRENLMRAMIRSGVPEDSPLFQ